jgi:acetyl-CoA C-acetyltransferase
VTEAFVYVAVRTPRGRVRKTGGTLAGVPAYELFAGLLRVSHAGQERLPDVQPG